MHKRRTSPSELISVIPSYISSDMPAQHTEFFDKLPYLPLATLDDQGRPWVSLLVTMANSEQDIGITVGSQNRLDLSAKLNPNDPFFRAVEKTRIANPKSDTLFAGVGIDFSNRRRNKLSGFIVDAQTSANGRLDLALLSNEHLGNCPKYITVRSLEPYTRNATLGFDYFGEFNSYLPRSCKDLINKASTVFLATKHISAESDQDERSDLGLNHRGGTPGFVRLYEEEEGDEVSSYLVLPDYSGNRFYQSLGNIQSSRLVGLAFPDFTNGNMLYVTGEAENLFDEDAQTLMPRTSLITRIKVTGAVFIEQGLNLKLCSKEQYSPYNPPLRYLRGELEQMGHVVDSGSIDEDIDATLVSITPRTESISTFTFKLSKAIDAPLPGGFAIFDFSDILDDGYKHMDEITPQAVNDDFIRTWTLSSAPVYDAVKGFNKTDHVSITVKRKEGGLISNFLHDKIDAFNKDAMPSLKVGFKGTGIGFSCFSSNDLDTIPSHMLWIAGGVGITPFMSMWDGLISAFTNQREVSANTDIVLLFSGRDDDLSVINHFLRHSSFLPSNMRITILAFQTSTSSLGEIALNRLVEHHHNVELKLNKRRPTQSDFAGIDRLLEREVYLCGPASLTRSSVEFLENLGGDGLALHQESYQF